MRLLLATLLFFLPAVAHADPPREMVEIRAGQPIEIRSDRAYMLFRRVRPEGVTAIEPVFMRIPSTAEVERYRAARRQAYARAEPGLVRDYQRRRERNPDRAGPPPSEQTFPFEFDEIANIQNIEDGRPLVRGRPESIFLVEIPPGEYVLYGATFGSGMLVDGLHACMCLGTVGFSARAGVVTDLGYFIADGTYRESPIPELRAESGFGTTGVGIVATVRPPHEGTAVPDVLRGATVVPVEYRAVGKFFDSRAGTINRLVAVPGVLAYDRGRVIDVRTGQEAEGGHY